MNRKKMIGVAAVVLIGLVSVVIAVGQSAKGPITELYVRTFPEGATVFVDGKQVGTSPALCETQPGEHAVTALLEGYETATARPTIAEGRIRRVILELKRLSTATAETPMVSTIDSDPMQVSVHNILSTGYGEGVGILGVAFSPDGQTVATIDETGTVILRNAHNWKTRSNQFQLVSPTEIRAIRKVFPQYGMLNEFYSGSIAFSPDGKMLAVGCGPVVKLYDVATGRLLQALHDPAGADPAKVRPGISEEETEALRKTLAELDLAHGTVQCVVFSPDSSLVATSGGHFFAASGATPGCLKLWDATTGELKYDMGLHHSDVRGVTFSPDGLTLTCTGTHPPGWTSSVRLWDVATGEARAGFSRPEVDPWSVAYSPDGKLLASGAIVPQEDGSPLGMLLVWDVQAGSLLIRRSLPKPVESLAFSADGEILASGEGDKGVTFWNPKTLQLLGRIDPIDPPAALRGLVSVAFSPSGNMIAVAAEHREQGGFLTLWEIDSAAEQPEMSGEEVSDPGEGTTVNESLPTEVQAAMIGSNRSPADILQSRGWNVERDEQGQVVKARWLAGRSAAEVTTAAIQETTQVTTDDTWQDQDLELFASLPHLKYLALTNSGVSDIATVQLARLRGLEELLLDDTDVGDTALAQIKTLPALRRLNLRGTKITDDGLKHLRDMVGLEELNLASTQITDRGLADLVGLDKLRWLALYRTAVSDDGLVHLKDLGQLENLYLGETRVTDAGLVDLQSLSKLKVLYLHDDQITDAGLKQLAEIPSLETLSLIRTQITDDGLEHLERLENLQSISVRQSKVTSAGIERFMEAMPDCRTDANLFRVAQQQSDQAESRNSAPREFTPRKLFSNSRQSEDTGILAMAFSPDGLTIAAVDEQSNVILWNPRMGILWNRHVLTPEEKKLLLYDQRQGQIHTAAIAFSPDGYTLAVAADPVVRLYDAHDGHLLLELKDKGLVEQLMELDRPPATVSRERELLDAVPHAHGRVYSVAFSPDGKLLATSGSHLIRSDGSSVIDPNVATGGMLKLWDVETGQLKQDLGEHYPVVRSVAFSPDGKTLASIGSHSPGWKTGVLFWNLQTGQMERDYTFRQGGLYGGLVGYSPDGRLIAVGAYFTESDPNDPTDLGGIPGRGLMMLDGLTGEPLVARRPPGLMTSLSFSANSKTLATGVDGQGVFFWDVETLKSTGQIDLSAELPQNVSAPVFMTFSPVGNLLAVGAKYSKGVGSVTVWEIGETAETNAATRQ